MPKRDLESNVVSLNHSAQLADFKVGVDNVIFSVDIEQHRLLILLILRQEPPFSDRWSLPGTLVRNGES
ncbi:MAG: NUDIX hydrolase, partial [Cyanobacteria bacterium P01_F01_bin.153]